MRNFMIGLLAGVGAAAIAGIALILFLGFYFSGPSLAARAEAPEQVALGDAFDVVVTIENPHEESVEFDNLDISDAFFERFAVDRVQPQADSGSPVGGFGSQTWFYDLDLEPKGQMELTLSMRALAEGQYVEEFDICNHYEDCTPVLLNIQVVPAP